MTSTRREFLASSLVAAGATLGGSAGAIAKPARAPGAPSTHQWDPATTWVFAVGILAYPDGEHWPQAGRRDAEMIEELQKRGVPASQIVFLKDKEGTRKSVADKFRAHLGKAKPGDTLWFYYAGHGSKSKEGIGQFVLYDENWPIPDVLSEIERSFGGTRALLFADCCYSGNLGQEAVLRAGRVSYGALTSSLSSTLSTGAWTFTECILSALRNQTMVDSDGDGQISLLELARHAEREMSVREGQLSTFLTANGFDARLALGSGSPKAHPKLGEFAECKAADGKWYPARLEKFEGGKFFVRFLGYDEKYNEWVAEANTRPLSVVQHKPGTVVEVEWEGKWYKAQTLAARHNMHLIRYDGYSSIWDEWVAPKRLRLVSK